MCLRALIRNGMGIVAMFFFHSFMYQILNMLSEFIIVEIMFYDCWWPLCQFTEVVNVENNFPLQIISCYILNK